MRNFLNEMFIDRMDMLDTKELGTEEYENAAFFFTDEASLDEPETNICSINELGAQLLQASADGDVPEIRSLMAKGAPFSADWLGTSPLHLAAQFNRLEVCNVLIRAGMTRDARTKVDRTPLHLAAYEGHIAIVECLINLGAEIDARDILNMTPLHWAAQQGNAEVVAILIRHGAVTDSVNNFNLTPSDIAMQIRRLDIVEIISMAIRDPTEAAKTLSMELLAEDSKSNSIHDVPATISIPDQNIMEDDNQDINDTSNIERTIPLVDTILARDENFESFPVINEEIVEAEGADPSRTCAIKFLEDHGISILPLDEGSILNSVMETGHSVVLTEAGKQALKSIKPGDINIEYVKPKTSTVKPKKIITMTSDQFMLMTQNGGFNGQTNILKQLNGKTLGIPKIPSNRIVMKKNKVVRIPQSSLNKEVQIQKGSKLQKIDNSLNDGNCLWEQLQKAYAVIENYKTELAKVESENARYKLQNKALIEQIEAMKVTKT